MMKSNTLKGPRIMATPCAYKYLGEFPFYCTEAFAEVKENRCQIITKKVKEILRKVKMNFTPDEVKDIPNWDKTLDDIIYDTEIWFVADSDRGITQLPVFNRFSRNHDWLSVPRWIDCGPDFNSDRIKELIGQIREIRVEIKKLKEKLIDPKSLSLLLLITIFRLLLNDQDNGIRLETERISPFWIEDFCMDLFDGKEMSVIQKAIEILEGKILEERQYDEITIKKVIKELKNLFEKITKKLDFLRDKELPPSVLNTDDEISDEILLHIIEMLLQHIHNSGFVIHIKSEISGLFKKINDLRGKINHNDIEDDEPSSTNDWLACYCPETGTILMRIDYIKETYENLYEGEFSLELFFQEILLHEFIHAAFDLAPRDKNGKIKGHYNKFLGKDRESDVVFNEETLDNVLVLQCYESTDFYHDIYSVISSQPGLYRKATYISEIAAEPALIRLLTWLISYKVYSGMSLPSSNSNMNSNIQLPPTAGRGEIIARFIEKWANGMELGNMYEPVAYQRIKNRFPASLRGGRNSTEPIIYRTLPPSSDIKKNFKQITVGNYSFHIATNIWTEERFNSFKKRAQEMIEDNPKLPKLWN